MTIFHQRRLWLNYRCILLFILFSLLPYLIAFVLSLFAVGDRLLITSVIYCINIAVFIWLQSVRVTHFSFLSISFLRKKGLPVVLVSIAVGVAAYIAALSVTFTIVSILIAIFGDGLPAWITASNQGFISFLEGDNAAVKVLWFMLITIAAPIVEEISFRGYLQDSIAQLCHHKMPKLTAVTVALIFALFHTNSLANMIFAFIVGLSLSFIRQRHGSLIPSMIAHGTVNAVSLLIGLIAA